jgi:hypothetical protein
MKCPTRSKSRRPVASRSLDRDRGHQHDHENRSTGRRHQERSTTSSPSPNPAVVTKTAGKLAWSSARNAQRPVATRAHALARRGARTTTPYLRGLALHAILRSQLDSRTTRREAADDPRRAHVRPRVGAARSDTVFGRFRPESSSVIETALSAANPGGTSRLSVAGGQRLATASRTAGTTSCAQRFSVVSVMVSPGRTM